MEAYSMIWSCASRGYTSCCVKLNGLQVNTLRHAGFVIQFIRIIPTTVDPQDCIVSWRYAKEGSHAKKLLDLAAKKNPALRK